MNERNQRLSADDIEALLPWYAAGTLDTREADQVEAALATDADLARRLDLVREEMTEAIILNEALGAPSARVMENLFSAIDRERRAGREPAAATGGLTGRLAELFSPRTYAFAGAAAVLLIAVEAAVIARLALQDRGVPSEGGGYTTASMPRQTDTPPIRGLERNLALVQFAPHASIADVTRFLNGRHAEILEGPDNGIYKVRLGERNYVTKDERDGLIKDFQSASNIIASASRGTGE
jgi:hypothetical protein